MFVDRQFFTPDQCVTLQASIQGADSTPAQVLKAGGVLEIDETARKTIYTQISSPLKSAIKSQLADLLPKLEQHFGVTLKEFEPPQCLHYQPGDFFRLHRDSSESDSVAGYLAPRKVSVVIFLNTQASSPADKCSDGCFGGCFGGGELTFYGLINEPRWQQYGFQLEGEMGLLVAFASDVLHEVCPVTWGDRYTIVTWFY